MSRLKVFFSFIAVLFPAIALAGTKDVKVETIPSGAQVEENGSLVCTTPCSIKVPSYYFGSKHTAFSGHGIEPIRLRITKAGFVPKNFDLTTGPIHWKNLYGNNLYDYYLVTSTQFTIRLDAVQEFVLGNDSKEPPFVRTSTAVVPTTSVENTVHDALPAVVRIAGANKSGSGFFIMSDGLIVTNAHVVRDESSVTVTVANGTSMQSSTIYTDEDRDLAFVKVAGTNYPTLRLQTALPNPGADVIAIGSPVSDQLTNSVTKGVVSGVRHGSHGVWIQTDTALNPGNSGGPLLNTSGEVVGVNTLKLVDVGVTGINFSLASSEIADLLKSRFGTSFSQPPATAPSLSTVAVTSTPAGADIEVDGVFLGNTPAELPLTVGERTLRISKKGYRPVERKLQVMSGGKQTISADLEQTSP
jgi:serine protease Do